MMMYIFPPDASPKMADIETILVPFNYSKDLDFLEKHQILAIFACEDGRFIVYNTSPQNGDYKMVRVKED